MEFFMPRWSFFAAKTVAEGSDKLIIAQLSLRMIKGLRVTYLQLLIRFVFARITCRYLFWFHLEHRE